MFRLPFAIAVTLFGLIGALARTEPAHSEELVTDLSEHLVAIKSNFTGTQILLFGAVEIESPEIRALARDIVVVVRGPATDVTVRQKARVAGIWMNYGSETYERAPGYYAVVSTRPLEAIASKDVLERHQIGTKYLRFKQLTSATANLKEQTPYSDAIVRLMTEQKLYSEIAGGVKLLGNTLFRATVNIPANVPVGIYTAEVYLIRGGNVIHAQASPLYINKSGFERFVYNLAHRQPLLYGVIAVALALFSGWLAAAAFRNR